ncbi:hypothetical protein OEZ85_007680 [Tetradesmus obliquus]|uniref:Uncharacterized protein n=1 Tax=Tetradesmus obliquus TaxID=3088 RepID=A0ABY8TGN8_TETOB|nr:hypothetical protein OEZ85_007680 [Tetradesmus obliquus]
MEGVEHAGDAFQEELHDHMIFFRLLPLGLYAMRTDPGMPLNGLLSSALRLVGAGIVAWAGVVEAGLQALGYLRKQD